MGATIQSGAGATTIDDVAERVMISSGKYADADPSLEDDPGACPAFVKDLRNVALSGNGSILTTLPLRRRPYQVSLDTETGNLR